MADQPEVIENSPAGDAPVNQDADGIQDATDDQNKEFNVEEVLGIKELLFGKYDLSEVVVHDLGLSRYINLSPIVVPHSGAKNANVMFGKRKMSIIERLINNMMRTSTYTGKKSKSYAVVREAFEIIERRSKKNPVQIFVEALENAAPMEEITRLRYGGISVPKAVDISPSRRLDVALRNITIGATKGSYKKKKTISQCLADEILTAAKGDLNSFAVSKKDEKERVAGSAR
jgi:small subunit ribosomal protein S7